MARSSFPNVTARPHRDLGTAKVQCKCCNLYFPAIETNSNGKCDDCDKKEQATMSNIRIEMNYYPYIKYYGAMVLYTDANGESASISYYPAGKKEAMKLLKALEAQYNVKGTAN